MLLLELEEAYQPAKIAYEIRKDILGNHPDTVRSAFQMAQICRCLEDYDEAEKYHEQTWEIEKSLGQGNHTEVMVRIIEDYEVLPTGVGKEEFQKETMCLSFINVTGTKKENSKDLNFHWPTRKSLIQ